MFNIYFSYVQIYRIMYKYLTLKKGFLLAKIYTIIQHPVWMKFTQA